MPDMDEDYGGMGGMDGFDGPEDEYGDGGGGGGGDSALGAVKLDNYTFDKVIGLPGQTVLVKFDKSFPYGDKEDEFKELCKAAYTAPNFFVGEVQVGEYGDMENDDLRKRYELSADDFPVFLLFRGPKDMQKYAGSVTAADISVWLRRNGVKISTTGTIAELDELVQKFIKGDLADSYIAEAEALAEGTYKGDSKAALYIKIMKKIKEKGVGYIATETARLQKVMQGNLTPEKMQELSLKVRLLSTFEQGGSEEL